jgi:hypothetical protein
MSYTNIEQIKKHINFSVLPASVISDCPVILPGLDWVRLPGRNIVDGSAVVKVVCALSPQYTTATLGDEPASLSHSRLVPGSVVIASDNSLGMIYTENVDYTIDYQNGIIRRTAEGSIMAGKIVSVWYYYYTPYIEGEDYSINYTDGKIRRLSSGAIQSGQTVLIDFILAVGQPGDDIIEATVLEADAIIEKEIDSLGSFGADPTLQSGATFLAVSLLFRIIAAEELRLGDTGRQSASSWLALSESYRRDYEQLIKDFRPGTARMNPPTIS